MCKQNIKTNNDDKYRDKALRFIDKDDHYELIFMDDFNIPTSGSFYDEKPETLISDIILDLKEADKNKELHIFVGSLGGYVYCLNMILQQILQFKHKVGINTGYACSCGFMLLSYCEEIYTSPFSSFMYHEMGGLSFGKVTEMKNKVDYDRNWWKLLLEQSRVNTILTPEELKLGETSEVWLTGKDLIDRGVAIDYSFYLKRNVPSPSKDEFFVVGNDVYRKEGDMFRRYTKDNQSKRKLLSYVEMVVSCFNYK